MAQTGWVGRNHSSSIQLPRTGEVLLQQEAAAALGCLGTAKETAVTAPGLKIIEFELGKNVFPSLCPQRSPVR